MRLFLFLCLFWTTFGLALDSVVLPLQTGEARVEASFPVAAGFALNIRSFEGRVRVRGTRKNELRLHGTARSSVPHVIRLDVKGSVAELYPSDPEADLEISLDEGLSALNDAPSLNDTGEMPVYDPLIVDLDIEIPENFLKYLRLSVSAELGLTGISLHGKAIVVAEVHHKSSILFENNRMPNGTAVLIASAGGVKVQNSVVARVFASSLVGDVSASSVTGDVELFSEKGSCIGKDVSGRQSGSGMVLALERRLAKGEVLFATSRRSLNCVLPLLTLPFAWDTH
ncbi:MAG: hypothetical protein KDD39_07840 [Bdellovibrionales bacterium]|nr:hypothetical protein [Bdellovibrionales bacterium]